jgi:hypothetical protein
MAKRRRVLRSEDGKIDLDKPINQEDFARLAGITQQEVSKLLRCSVLSPNGTGIEWIRSHLRFLMGQTYAKGGWRALEKFF